MQKSNHKLALTRLALLELNLIIYKIVLMKRSIFINLFLVLTTMFAASTVVDDAFEASTRVFTVNKIEVVASKPAKVLAERQQDYTPQINNVSKSVNTIEKVSYAPVVKIAHKKTSNKKETKNPLKINQLKKLKVTSLDLSYSEIEEQSKISNKKLKKSFIADFSFKLSDYSKIKLEKNNDRISTIASAPEKSKVKNTTINKDVISQKETTDELVFFDYSEDGKVKTTEVVAESTSIAVDSTIHEGPNLKGTSPNLVGVKVSSQKVDAPKLQDLKLDDIRKSIRKKVKENSVIDLAQNNKNYDVANSNGANYSNPDVRKAISSLIEDDKSEDEDYSCLDQKRLVSKNYKSEFTVSLSSINYKKDNFKPIHDFEIRFHDDEDDIVQDFGEGKIVIKDNLSTQMNIRRATLLASSHYPTVFDFVFEGTKASIEVPMFKKDVFEDLIKSLGITGIGAHLLIELDEKTEDIEIAADSKYERKVYLNKNLKDVDRDNADYSYILFLGVDPGNTIVNFKNIKNEISNKIIHLTEKEIYYDPNFYAEILDDKVELFKEGLLSKCKGLLNIEVDKIKSWSFDGKVTKKSLNSYSLGRMIYPIGTRKYMELSHLDESIFVGRWGQDPVIVPSEEYVRHALGNFDIRGSECLVQVNLTKDLKNFSYNAQSKNGYVRTQARFLDKDGSFYTDLSNDSKRIFVVGEEQGIINMKLEYTDGSSQYLQTFCSDNTYLVEQL
ncbi:MAG: hypothetical protein ACJAS4_003030 [Bacteriovoracaceae bacterium]|jgi:hypothetical protein